MTHDLPFAVFVKSETGIQLTARHFSLGHACEAAQQMSWVYGWSAIREDGQAYEIVYENGVRVRDALGPIPDDRRNIFPRPYAFGDAAK
jgi:hypothetical protein